MSEKTDTLMVNVFDYTSSQQVIILLNTEPETVWKYDNLTEVSIQIVSSLSALLISQGVPVSLYTNARDLITKEAIELPAGSGSNHFQSIQEALARIDLNLDSKQFLPLIQKKLMDTTANDYLIVISYNQKEELQQLMLDQIRVKREFTWVIPTNKDIKVRVSEEILDHIIEWELNE